MPTRCAFGSRSPASRCRTRRRSSATDSSPTGSPPASDGGRRRAARDGLPPFGGFQPHRRLAISSARSRAVRGGRTPPIEPGEAAAASGPDDATSGLRRPAPRRDHSPGGSKHGVRCRSFGYPTQIASPRRPVPPGRLAFSGQSGYASARLKASGSRPIGIVVVSTPISWRAGVPDSCRRP
jgi:hypothetical protein